MTGVEGRVALVTGVDHLKTRVPIRHVGVVADNGHAMGIAWGVDRAHDLREGGIADIDHVKTERPVHYVRVVVCYGDDMDRAWGVY